MNDTLPTLYEYYTSSGIYTGLSTSEEKFLLNGKEFTIYGGSVHYFKVPQEYWKDRLTKLKAAGLNTVETYIPWNLHEPSPGVYDFGSGGTDFENFLDVEKFLHLVKETDLFAIVRPGPYICAEWEFGGMPSWLLRNYGIDVRTNDKRFMEPVRRYFAVLFSILTTFQFVNGGPIIAFQIENEYPQNNFKDDMQSLDYMFELQKIFVENGVEELMLTCNIVSDGNMWKLPGVLYSANMNDHVNQNLRYLTNYEHGKPILIMEFWTGWYDSWSLPRQTFSLNAFTDSITYIISAGASINFYMFHGGTNFGFMNGATFYQSLADSTPMSYLPVTNTYDYSAPLTESGDYTEKYFIIEKIVKKYNKVKTTIPKKPLSTSRRAYAPINVTFQLSLMDILEQSPYYRSSILIPMEMLPINNNAGQSYGYIVYRKTGLYIAPYSTIKIHGYIKDTVMILINGELMSQPLYNFGDKSFGIWKRKVSVLQTGGKSYRNIILDIIVENYGRIHYGKIRQFNDYKGLWHNNVTINDMNIGDWNIYPLEFKKSWTMKLQKWKTATFPIGPTLYIATIQLTNIFDTYLDMRAWHKGIVIVNGFVLSRYFKIGPQQTAYLPAPFLKQGLNVILIFEHFIPHSKVSFSKEPIFYMGERYNIVTPLIPSLNPEHNVEWSSDSNDICETALLIVVSLITLYL